MSMPCLISAACKLIGGCLTQGCQQYVHGLLDLRRLNNRPPQPQLKRPPQLAEAQAPPAGTRTAAGPSRLSPTFLRASAACCLVVAMKRAAAA